MQKRAPTLGNMLVIILFCLSCFGLLLFLWESFGGPVPLKPKGYQMTVAFPRPRRARPSARKPDRERRAHLPRRRRSQSGVGADLEGTARIRAQLNGGA